jgi:uncharacterized protein
MTRGLLSAPIAMAGAFPNTAACGMSKLDCLGGWTVEMLEVSLPPFRTLAMKPLGALTSEMIEELHEFLLSDQTPDDCMLVTDLDGFLAGVVIGPELIMPSEWMPVIWHGEQPDFRSLEQAERIMGIVMTRYNEIIRSLDDEPSTFAPILDEAPDGRPLAADWAEGFMDALGLCPDAWEPLFEDKATTLLMGPILAQLHDKDGKSLIDGSVEEQQKIRAEGAEALPHVVKKIYDFWKAQRRPAPVVRGPAGKKVGRNEPCPCGCGRKYKRCCGAN